MEQFDLPCSVWSQLFCFYFQDEAILDIARGKIIEVSNELADGSNYPKTRRKLREGGIKDLGYCVDIDQIWMGVLIVQ